MKTKLLKMFRKRFTLVKHGSGHALLDHKRKRIIVSPVTDMAFQHVSTAIHYVMPDLIGWRTFRDLCESNRSRKQERAYLRVA